MPLWYLKWLKEQEQKAKQNQKDGDDNGTEKTL